MGFMVANLESEYVGERKPNMLRVTVTVIITHDVTLRRTEKWGSMRML